MTTWTEAFTWMVLALAFFILLLSEARMECLEKQTSGMAYVTSEYMSAQVELSITGNKTAAKERIKNGVDYLQSDGYPKNCAPVNSIIRWFK